MAMVGAIPEDEVLEAVGVQDVQRVLGARLLYGGTHGDALSTAISDIKVASPHLSDFLPLLHTHSDLCRGTLVVAHTTRPDILLGMQVGMGGTMHTPLS